jgi:hypothetical protein
MKKLALSCLIIVTSILTGCASPALIEKMTVPATALKDKSFDGSLKKAMAVTNVQGYEKTASFLATADFKTALINSLNSADLVTSSAKGQYEVSAVMSNVELPAFAFDMKATITVNYTVNDAAGKETFKKTVISEGIATAGEAFAGTERLKIAIERSVQSNISGFIDALSSFKP